MKSGLELFMEYLRFASISADPGRTEDVGDCARWLADLLGGWGMEAGLRDAGGPPVVIARTPPVAGAVTLLVYGHYDVQPAEPLALWDSPAFEPEVRGGMVFARGATDNKGQTFSHLLGLKAALDEGPLPVNVVVVIEGEEEVGSPHFADFLAAYREELHCDAVLISDTSMVAPGRPALTLGLRGIACFDVVVEGPARDLHSGMFGGAVTNPALALAGILARMTDGAGRVMIPGFNDGIIPVPASELEAWAELPWDAAWFEAATGIAPCGGEEGFSLLERVWARPTAEINGLSSGYQGAGSKTIVPSKASAKLSFRLVPGQTAAGAAAAIEAWFEDQFAAAGLKGAIKYDHGGEPFYTPPDNLFIAAAMASLEDVFGRVPDLTREGLSIPAAVMMQQTLGVPVVLLGLGLPDCQAHAPNESYPVSHLDAGAAFFSSYLRALGRLNRPDGALE